MSALSQASSPPRRQGIMKDLMAFSPFNVVFSLEKLPQFPKPPNGSLIRQTHHARYVSSQRLGYRDFKDSLEPTYFDDLLLASGSRSVN